MIQNKDTSFETQGSYDDKVKFAMEPKKEKSNINNYLYNAKTSEIFGRTLFSWTLIAGYSSAFVVCLAIFWGLMLCVFYQTLDNYEPRLQTTSSFIGHNPGLGFRPMRLETDPYSSLIWFRHGGDGDWDQLKTNLDKFLQEYEPGYWANAGASQTKCHWGRGPLTKTEACEFNKEWLSDQGSDIKCITEEHYGYYHGKPCILVKLNRVYGWQPEPYYNLTEVDQVEGMPDQLKGHIRTVWEQNCRGKSQAVQDRCPELNMVWLHCDGEDDPDKENIGTVSYTPWQGFPTYFFPYWNQLGYLQPIVMVQLKNPTPGVLINMHCTAWSKGMQHDLKLKRGGVHIEFLMD